MTDEDTFPNPTPEEIAGWAAEEMPADRPSGRYARAIPSSAIPKKQQHWLIPDMIPLNTLTVFGGIGGEGKSSMMIDIAAKLSRGELDGDVREPASTLILSVEDDWATQMGPRLEAAGANEDLVFKSVVESYIAESGTMTETKAVLPLDLGEIAYLVREVGAKLLVFDPAMSFMDGDPNKAIDVRRAFDPVSTLAQTLDIAVLLIAHFNKGGGSVGAKLSGSHAWRDLTRSYWGFAKDNETGKRVFSSDKGNYSKADGLSFEFDIVSRDVFIEGVPKSYGAVANIQATDLTVGDLIDRDRESEKGDSSTEVEECKEWLLDLLDREPFDMPRKSVVAAAKSEGFSTATLNRARAKAGVWTTSTKTFPTTSVWAHPRIAPTGETTETTGKNENVSRGQNSYRTVVSPEEKRDDCETTGLTRDDVRQQPSHLSHLSDSDTATSPEPRPIWGQRPEPTESADDAPEHAPALSKPPRHEDLVLEYITEHGASSPKEVSAGLVETIPGFTPGKANVYLKRLHDDEAVVRVSRGIWDLAGRAEPEVDGQLEMFSDSDESDGRKAS